MQLTLLLYCGARLTLVNTFEMTNFQQRDMANTYGVSRGTVREALTKLMENGLVEIKHGSGTYVTFDGKASTPNAIQSAIH